jgi:predicted NBD/HSP70 family sugar kinase
MDVRRSTIGSIVNSLIEAEIIEESPENPRSGVGKPPRPLWFGRYAGLSGAIFLRDGVIETALVNARGDILRRDAEHFDPQASGDALEKQVLSVAKRVLGRYRGRLAGIGLAVPAVVDAAGGRIIACTPIPGLVDTSLPAALERWGKVPIVLEDDVAALALGERWFGQGRGVRDFAAVQVGDGIGAAIVLAGHLLRGQRVASIEIGHTCVDPNGRPCRCGLRGCWETIASTGWLRSRASEVRLAGASGINPGRLVAMASAGDATAASLLDEYADHLAIGLANMVQLFSLDLFILHGDVVQGGPPLVERIRAAVARRSLRVLVDDVRVSFSALERDSGLLGAAATVMTSVLGISV